MARVQSTDVPLSVVVVGGGAGGVELAMALQHRLKQAAEVAGTAQPSVTYESENAAHACRLMQAAFSCQCCTARASVII